MKTGDLIRHRDTEIECGEIGIVLKIDSEKSYGGEVEVMWHFLSKPKWHIKKDLRVIYEKG